MRRLNVRLLLIMTFTSILLAVGVYSLHKYQIQRHADMYLHDAREARAAGRTAEALGLVQRYVSLRPADVDGLAEYASLLSETGRIDGAYLVYEQVLRRDPQRDSVRREMVDLAIRLRRYLDAKEHIQKLQAENPTPDCDLLAALGNCHQSLGEYEDAAKAFGEAIENQCQPEVYEGLARLLRTQMDQPDQARQWIERVIVDHPDDYRSYIIRGNWNLREQRSAGGRSSLSTEDSVWEDALHAVRLADNEPEVVWFLVRAAENDDQIAEARQRVLEVLSKNPSAVTMYGAAAELDVQAGNRKAAIEMLQRGLQQAPGTPDLMWNLASLQLEDGKLAEVKQAVEALEGTGYPSAPLAYLRARLLISERKWLAAAQELAGIGVDVQESPEFQKQINYWLGICHRNLGNQDQATVAFRRAISIDPLWGPAREGLATTHFTKGDVTAALEEYWQLANLPNPPLAAGINLARLIILANLRRDSADRDWQAVEDVLNGVEHNAPDATDVPILRAEVAFLRGDTSAAERLLDDAIAVHQDDQRLRLAQIALMTRREQWTRVAELLLQARDRFGDTVSLRLAEAGFLVARDENGSADQLAGLADAPRTWTEEDRTALAAGLAKIHLAAGNDVAAERFARIVAEAEPGNLLVRLLLFDLSFRRQDESALENILTEIRQIEGEGPLWRYGKAIQLTLRAEQTNHDDDYATAKRHLNEAALQRPSWSRIPSLLGEILERQGDEGAAMEKYSEAIHLGERRPRSIARAAALFFRNERFIEADQMLRRLQEQEQENPFSPELMRFAAEISLELEDVDRALEFSERAASAANTPENHLWLGQIHEINGNHSDAEAELRSAISLQPDALEYWVALVQFLGRRGDVAAAEATIEEARVSVEPDRRAFLAAQCYESLGDATLAEAEYLKAIDTVPHDTAVLRSLAAFYLRQGSFDQAEPWLRQLLGEETSTEPEDEAWARRSLALGLGHRRGQQSYLKAQQLIDQNLAREPKSREDRRAKARILAARPLRRDRQSAIRLFEELLSTGWKPSEDDQFLLAQLYITDNNDWNRGSQLLRGLLTRQGSSDPQIIARYARLLLQRGENAEAELWLDRLQEIAPTALPTQELELQLLFNRKQYDRLYATLDRGIAPEDDRQAPGEAEHEALRRRAGWFEAFSKAMTAQGNLDQGARFARAAEAGFRKLVADHPAEASRLAGYFARNGDIESALKVLEEFSSTISADELASSGRLLLARASEAQQLRLLAIIETALQSAERPASLVLFLADLQSWRQQIGPSARLYKEVLDRDPQNIIALNNQAMLMALAQKRIDEAMATITAAIHVAGPIAALLDTRGVIQLTAGNAQDALADFDEALLEQETVDRSFHRCHALLVLGRFAEAQDAFQRAIELGIDRNQLHPLERPTFDQLVQRFGSGNGPSAAIRRDRALLTAKAGGR